MIHDSYVYSYPETLAASGFQENLKNFEQHLSFTITNIHPVECSFAAPLWGFNRVNPLGVISN